MTPPSVQVQQLINTILEHTARVENGEGKIYCGARFKKLNLDAILPSSVATDGQPLQFKVNCCETTYYYVGDDPTWQEITLEVCNDDSVVEGILAETEGDVLAPARKLGKLFQQQSRHGGGCTQFERVARDFSLQLLKEYWSRLPSSQVGPFKHAPRLLPQHNNKRVRLGYVTGSGTPYEMVTYLEWDASKRTSSQLLRLPKFSLKPVNFHYDQDGETVYRDKDAKHELLLAGSFLGKMPANYMDLRKGASLLSEGVTANLAPNLFYYLSFSNRGSDETRLDESATEALLVERAEKGTADMQIEERDPDLILFHVTDKLCSWDGDTFVMAYKDGAGESKKSRISWEGLSEQESQRQQLVSTSESTKGVRLCLKETSDDCNSDTSTFVQG